MVVIELWEQSAGAPVPVSGLGVRLTENCDFADLREKEADGSPPPAMPDEEADQPYPDRVRDPRRNGTTFLRDLGANFGTYSREELQRPQDPRSEREHAPRAFTSVDTRPSEPHDRAVESNPRAKPNKSAHASRLRCVLNFFW